MRTNKNKWVPDQQTVDLMLRMRLENHTYKEIAAVVGRSKDLVGHWFLMNTGKVIGNYKGYHSKDEVHKRCWVYFDCTSLAEDLKGDCDA